ncbi:MAG TPA: winged helix DNA-binding domain-containing protein [Solirubrobacteraceae bacterium]|nr:winged helix DNA-binding domain-containing protein [Solirubrobacteraceae bacterium]
MSARRPRTLTTRELNRALLARQMLLQRARLSLPRALERMGGLQAQYAPSMYIGLWSRLEGFERAALTAALERRTVVQATLLRSTIHLVSRRDYWPWAIAVRASRREHWLRVARDAPGDAEMTAAARRLREALRGGTMRRTDVEALIGKRTAQAVNLWLNVVRAPPSGTWERRRADLYAAAEDWLGPPPAGVDERAGLDLLVRRYLAAFGPATRNDLVSWSGVPIGALQPSLDRTPLRRFRSEAGDELIDLPRARLPPAEVPAPVRFLPTFDATLLVHARRTQILPEEYRERIFNVKTPHSAPTFLVDGAVAGTWRYDAGRVDLEPFVRLHRETTRELREEAARLAALHT